MRSARRLWVRLVVVGVVLGKMVSCSSSGDGKGDGSGLEEFVSVRISPVRVESVDPGDPSAWALFDRDTRTGWSPSSAPPSSSTQVRVALGQATRITHLKIFGASPYVLGVRASDGTPIQGLEHMRLDTLGAGWNALRLPDTTSADELVLDLARTDGGDASAPAPLGEIELWGVDRPAPLIDVKLVGTVATSSSSPATAPPGLDVLAATDPGPVTLGPSSEPGGQACGKIRFALSRSPASYRRAWLVYAADGAFRSFVLTRTLNAAPARRGQWFSAGGWASAVRRSDRPGDAHARREPLRRLPSDRRVVPPRRSRRLLRRRARPRYQ